MLIGTTAIYGAGLGLAVLLYGTALCSRAGRRLLRWLILPHPQQPRRRLLQNRRQRQRRALNLIRPHSNGHRTPDWLREAVER